MINFIKIKIIIRMENIHIITSPVQRIFLVELSNSRNTKDLRIKLFKFQNIL